MRSLLASSARHSTSVDVTLPADKLCCKRGAHKDPYKPVVLLSCGSFNPPTHAHLRMFELALQQLAQVCFSTLFVCYFDVMPMKQVVA